MLERLWLIVQHICFLDLTKPLVVGVSGGPDSLCLLDVLHRLEFRVVVAHLNHGLRPEADEELEHVASFTRGLGLPYASRKVDTGDYAAANLLSIEEAARVLRYRFLFEQANRYSAQAVAVAHTADDQAETVLMHFLRGAGLPGLKGMPARLLPNPWSETIPLVRPLLTTWREEVLAYCRERGLEPVEDQTNLDTRFTRNRLRHETIPSLEKDYPGLRKTLARSAQVLAGEDEIVQAAVAVAWKVCVANQGEGYVAYHVPALKTQPTGVQRRLLRRGMEVLRPGLRDIDMAAVERARAFLANPTRTGRRDLVAGLALSYEGDRLYLASWEAGLPSVGWPQMPAEAFLELPVPGHVELPDGWRIEAEWVEDAGQAYRRALENDDPTRVWLDAGRLELPLMVRGRRPGDRFQPLGMDGHSMKVSDFLINVKLPRRARAGWPLVVSGGQLAWITGYRLAHPFRLTPETRRVVDLKISPV